MSSTPIRTSLDYKRQSVPDSSDTFSTSGTKLRGNYSIVSALSKASARASQNISSSIKNTGAKLYRKMLSIQNTRSLTQSFQRFEREFNGRPAQAAFEFTKFVHKEMQAGKVNLDIRAYPPADSNKSNGWKSSVAFTTIYNDHPITVVAFSWGKGQFCEIHGHKNDCGFIRGISRVSEDVLFDREYSINDKRELIEEVRLTIGRKAARLYNPEAHAIHRMEAPLSNKETVVSFHFYARGPEENGAIDLHQLQSMVHKAEVKRLPSGEFSFAANTFPSGLDPEIHANDPPVSETLKSPKCLLSNGQSFELSR